MVTYYVRQSTKPVKDREFYYAKQDDIVTKISTPKRLDALKSAADSAILHPGNYYYVYNGNEIIAKFYVKDEEN